MSATVFYAHAGMGPPVTGQALVAKDGFSARYDLDRVLTENDLVKGDDIFFACTGITDGALVQGVRFFTDGATTESIVMRASSGTIRVIRGEHRVGKLKQIYGEEA